MTAAAAPVTFVEFARRGRNAWWRYPATLLVAIVLAIVVGVAIALPLIFLGVPPQSLTAELTKPTRPPLFMLAVGFNFALVLAGLFLAARLVQRKSPGDLIGRWRWSQVATGVGVWLAMMVAMTLADVAIAPGAFRWSAAPGTLLLGVCAIFALGLQAFTEEVLFRGYITQGMLLATRRPIPAAILAGLVFGAAHIPNGLPQAVSATGFGIAASLIAIRLGGVAFTFGLHWINNLFGAVVVVASNDVFRGFPGLVSQSGPGLVWFDVGTNLLALAIVGALILRLAPSPGSLPILAEASG